MFLITQTVRLGNRNLIEYCNQYEEKGWAVRQIVYGSVDSVVVFERPQS